jgi:1-acyl-sn-glycerol-3-phosphate acyltransferase
MVRRLKKGRSLILFPEGHMHKGEGLEEFKRGGIHTAVLAGVPIVPVCLSGTAEVIPIGSMHIRPRRKVIVDFGEPIETADLGRDARRNIDGIVRNRLLAMKASARSQSGR